jgi:hypothetical protein
MQEFSVSGPMAPPFFDWPPEASCRKALRVQFHSRHGDQGLEHWNETKRRPAVTVQCRVLKAISHFVAPMFRHPKYDTKSKQKYDNTQINGAR